MSNRNGQERRMGSRMMRWRWLPSVLIAVAVYIALRCLAVAIDGNAAFLTALMVVAVGITIKLLDRPKT